MNRLPTLLIILIAFFYPIGSTLLISLYFEVNYLKGFAATVGSLIVVAILLHLTKKTINRF
jgi:hypothetical protein